MLLTFLIHTVQLLVCKFLHLTSTPAYGTMLTLGKIVKIRILPQYGRPFYHTSFSLSIKIFSTFCLRVFSVFLLPNKQSLQQNGRMISAPTHQKCKAPPASKAGGLFTYYDVYILYCITLASGWTKCGSCRRAAAALSAAFIVYTVCIYYALELRIAEAVDQCVDGLAFFAVGTFPVIIAGVVGEIVQRVHRNHRMSAGFLDGTVHCRHA